MLGRELYREGAANSNVLPPYLLVRIRGITKSSEVEDLRDLEGTYGVRRSDMYAGASTLRALYIVVRILYMVYSGMGSQWSLARTGVILLYFPDLEANQAALF